MLDFALLIDIVSLIGATCAFIAGTTPPVTLANKEERKRASKDLIGKYGFSSNLLIYGVHASMTLFTVLQLAIIIHAYRTNSTIFAKAVEANVIRQSWLRTIFKATSSNEILKPNISSTQAWLLDHRVRSWFRITSAFAIVGGIFRVICFRTLGHFFTFDLSIREDHKVIQTGPYGAFHPKRETYSNSHTDHFLLSLIILPAYVRHPSYAAMIILCIGQVYSIFVYGPLISAGARSLAWSLVTLFLVIPGALITMRIRDEEPMLQRELGKEYTEYMQKVPARLIPYLF